MNDSDILTLETFRKVHTLRKNVFFHFLTNLCRFDVFLLLNTVIFSSKKKLHAWCVPFGLFWTFQLTKILKHCSINMKKLHKLESFGLFDHFCVKLKHIFIRNRHLSLQKTYWTTHSVVERFQRSVLFNLLKMWQKLHKKFLSLLVPISAFFHRTLAFISQQRPPGLWFFFFFERLHHSKAPSLSKNVLKLHENLKKIWLFVDFGLNLRHFRKANCIYLFGEASWTTNSVLLERF